MLLPKPLQPWSAELALFPADLASVLEAQLRQLGPLFGASPREAAAADGDPDGYDGLARRGSPEQLLVSEWALAQELPDEFLRRAIMGEQAHLKRALRAPAGARVCTVLFDAGPSQLGAPRLAHLALLILLFRRAVSAGAAFRWGILQQPVTLATELSTQQVTHLLEARSNQEVDAELGAQWQEVLMPRSDPRGATSEVWVIGGARATGVVSPRHVGRVRIAESEEGRQLDLEVWPRHGARRSTQLPLPAEDLGIRLLREPFKVVRMERSTARSPSPRLEARLTPHFVFGAYGRELAFLEQDGSLAALALPNSPRDLSVPRIRRLRFWGNERVIAFGSRRRGGLMAATWIEEAERLTLHGLVGGSKQAFIDKPLFSPGPSPRPLLWQERRHPAEETFLLQDHAGSVWTYRLGAGTERPEAKYWGGMSAPFQAGEKVVAIERDLGGRDRSLVVRDPEGTLTRHPLLHGDGDRRMVVGDRTLGKPEIGACVAVRSKLEPESWQVITNKGTLRLFPPSGTEVFGVCGTYGWLERPRAPRARGIPTHPVEHRGPRGRDVGARVGGDHPRAGLRRPSALGLSHRLGATLRLLPRASGDGAHNHAREWRVRTSSAKPLSLAHRGVVRAQGFLIDSGLLGEATARRRVLAHWAPGARVHPVSGGYVLLLAEPRHVASDAAPGLLVTAHGQGLTTVPLTPGEARAHVLEAGSILRVVGGVARVEVAPACGGACLLAGGLDLSRRGGALARCTAAAGSARTGAEGGPIAPGLRLRHSAALRRIACVSRVARSQGHG